MFNLQNTLNYEEKNILIACALLASIALPGTLPVNATKTKTTYKGFKARESKDGNPCEGICALTCGTIESESIQITSDQVSVKATFYDADMVVQEEKEFTVTGTIASYLQEYEANLPDNAEMIYLNED